MVIANKLDVIMESARKEILMLPINKTQNNLSLIDLDTRVHQILKLVHQEEDLIIEMP